MSSSYRESVNKAKAARLAIVDQSEKVPGKKPKGEVVVEYRYHQDQIGLRLRDNRWSKWGSYRTEAIALSAIANLSRKYTFYELRIQPKGGPV